MACRDSVASIAKTMHEKVGAVLTKDVVITSASDDDIVSCTGVNIVRAAVTKDQITPAAGRQDVVPVYGATFEAIIIITCIDLIIATDAVNGHRLRCLTEIAVCQPPVAS